MTEGIYTPTETDLEFDRWLLKDAPQWVKIIAGDTNTTIYKAMRLAFGGGYVTGVVAVIFTPQDTLECFEYRPLPKKD